MNDTEHLVMAGNIDGTQALLICDSKPEASAALRQLWDLETPPIYTRVYARLPDEQVREILEITPTPAFGFRAAHSETPPTKKGPNP